MNAWNFTMRYFPLYWNPHNPQIDNLTTEDTHVVILHVVMLLVVFPQNYCTV